MRYTSHDLWTALFGSAQGLTVPPDYLESQMLLYGVKSVYGWACYACAALVIGFFLFDSPIRRHRSYMIPWRLVGEAVRKYYDVKSSGEDEQ